MPATHAADLTVAIIGGGLSGIGMGIALRRAGITDFAILERADDVGGTWRDNTYPGIGVDIPAQAYQFSYELKPDWSRVFAKGHEVKAYVDQCVDRYGLGPHIRLDSEVTARTWDEGAGLWRLELNGGGEQVSARYVVSAIGAFVDPKPVDIPGLQDFGGTVLRSASWDHDHDLTGRRVAIIGTGASAVQIIPTIAGRVAHLDVYQRTAIWVAPKLDPTTPAALKRAYARFPRLQNAVRAAATKATEAGLITAVVRYQEGPVRRTVDGLTWLLRHGWYRVQVPDAALRARLTPSYALGCKRPAVSNTYLRTFTRDHVDLLTDTIARITPDGVQTADGTERPVDTLILATGFRLASDPENFRRTPVRGRDGFDLATTYAEQRLRSYEGVSMPGLPNHFMIFGPYGWTGGTWHSLVETASAHIVRVIAEAQRRGARAVEVREEPTDRWTAFAADRLSRSLWKTGAICASAHSYYFDHHGDTPFLRPTSTQEAWKAHTTFPLEDYAFR